MKKKAVVTLKQWIGILLCILVSGILYLPHLTAMEPMDEIRIGDGKGDWGDPNPYRHYPRGPGYVRMSWALIHWYGKMRTGISPDLQDHGNTIPKTRALFLSCGKM